MNGVPRMLQIFLLAPPERLRWPILELMFQKTGNCSENLYS